MSAPCKPWESGTPCSSGPTQSIQTTELVNNSPIIRPMYGQGMYSSSPQGLPPVVGVAHPQGPPVRRVPRTAPPIPPPLNGGAGLSGYQGYSSAMGYNSPYGSYGASSYGMGGYGSTGYGMGGYGASSYGMGGYGGYGASSYGMNRYSGTMGGYGMNRYPGQQPGNNLESRFIQMAEESSRPAFDSIESLVQTFGSVNFMMESTFGALYSSFRAVLGVAENFGRLRTLFGQVFSSFAIIRTFQWIYKKLLYYLGLRPDNPGRESIWQQAAAGGALPVDPAARKTFWPVALFLGLVCSGPYLVWKLLNSLNMVPPTADVGVVSNPSTWGLSEEPTMVAVAKYPFAARNNAELSVRANQNILIAPTSFQTASSSEWVTASDGRTVGLVPRNYIKVIGQRKRNAPAAHQAVSVPEAPPSLVQHWTEPIELDPVADIIPTEHPTLPAPNPGTTVTKELPD